MKKIVVLLLVAILAISVVAPAFAEKCKVVGCNKTLSWQTTSQTMTEDSWLLFLYLGFWKWTRTTSVLKCSSGHVASSYTTDSERVFYPVYSEPGPYIN